MGSLISSQKQKNPPQKRGGFKGGGESFSTSYLSIHGRPLLNVCTPGFKAVHRFPPCSCCLQHGTARGTIGLGVLRLIQELATLSSSTPWSSIVRYYFQPSPFGTISRLPSRPERLPPPTVTFCGTTHLPNNSSVFSSLTPLSR